MKVLFGASGQLGSSIFRHLRERAAQEVIHPLKWSEVGHLNESELETLLTSFTAKDAPCDYVFASGLTDPRAPQELLQKSNLDFVKKVVQATQHLKGARYVTFGTIFENFSDACRVNPYLKTKADLGKWVQEQQDQNDPQRFLHIRLHTLYGGKVVPHMFLGQMMKALDSDSEFKMTRGDQIREYHHVDDISQAVVNLLVQPRGQPWTSGVVEMNSGKPLQIKKIARTVFEAFGKPHLLAIGAIDSPIGENKETGFKASSKEILPESRDALEGIVTWLKSIRK